MTRNSTHTRPGSSVGNRPGHGAGETETMASLPEPLALLQAAVLRFPALQLKQAELSGEAAVGSLPAEVDLADIDRLLALVDEQILQGRLDPAAVQSMLAGLGAKVSSPALAARLKRLSNRLRSRELLGRDLLQQTASPPDAAALARYRRALLDLEQCYNGANAQESDDELTDLRAEPAQENEDVVARIASGIAAAEAAGDRTASAKAGAAPGTAPGAASPASFADRYKVVDRLGEGGMSEVFLAVRREDGREMAIKFLRREFFRSEKIVARFGRECALCKKLNHPHIVELVESGQHMGSSYLVMPRYPLGSLDRVLTQDYFSPRMALQVCLQLGDALCCIHGLGIIHRDIKPSNLLLESYDPAAGHISIRLTDFGICKDLEAGKEGLTTVGSMLHTEYYSPPEQRVDPGQVDHRADIYAFGVLLYRLLSKTRFPVGSDYPSLGSRLPDLPETLCAGLDSLVHDCIRHEPDQRPQDMASVVTRLRKLVEQIAVFLP